MIQDALTHARRYREIPYLDEILSFVQHCDGGLIKEPEIEILGRDLFVRTAEYLTGPASEKRFEAHRCYADLQWVWSGREVMQAAAGSQARSLTDYDPAGDIQFFEAPQHYSSLLVSAGEFVFFYPGEFHRPCCQTDQGPEKVKKMVFKIRMSHA